MHLLAATPGGQADGAEAVDLGQSPGDLVFLSAADTEIAGLAQAVPVDFPALRLANTLQLGHNFSVDLYVDEVAAGAKLVICRLLGGAGYWSYGVERLVEVCAAKAIPLALLPGDAKPDADLAERSTVPANAYARLWDFLIQGGPANYANFLGYAASLIGFEAEWAEPVPLPAAGLYWPGEGEPDLSRLQARWQPGRPVAAITFYRALFQAGNLAALDGLIEALDAAGLNALPFYVTSLKDAVSAALLGEAFAKVRPAVVLNCTGFAQSTPGAGFTEGPFAETAAPVLQVVFSGQTEASWAAGKAGLSARDIAMNVALPEVDGRLITRAVSFKAEARFDQRTQASLVAYAPKTDRLAFVARLAAGWAGLAAKRAGDRRIAFVLANYPNKDGRLGNGVGLDTPGGLFTALKAMAAAGYSVEDLPESGRDLIERLAAGPTNALEGRNERPGGIRYALADYHVFLESLPQSVTKAVTERWGKPEVDPHVSGNAFLLSAYQLGN
ncbi:MAG: cobaltochelatase subunit CobN, partial [Rhodospirillales bacterium]